MFQPPWSQETSTSSGPNDSDQAPSQVSTYSQSNEPQRSQMAYPSEYSQQDPRAYINPLGHYNPNQLHDAQIPAYAVQDQQQAMTNVDYAIQSATNDTSMSVEREGRTDMLAQISEAEMTQANQTNALASFPNMAGSSIPHQQSRSDTHIYQDVGLSGTQPELSGSRGASNNSGYPGSQPSSNWLGEQQQQSSQTAFSTQSDGSFQRANRPSPLKLDLSGIDSGLSVFQSESQTPQNRSREHEAAEQPGAATAQPSQSRFAPLPQLQPALYEPSEAGQSSTSSVGQSSDGSELPIHGLLPAFGSLPTQRDQTVGSSVSHRPILYTDPSQGAYRDEPISASASSSISGTQEHLGSLAYAGRDNVGSVHYGLPASSQSPQLGGQHSPTSTLSGVFSSRPGSRPVSRGLKSMASFTSTASTGVDSTSDYAGGRPRSTSGTASDMRSALSRTTSMPQHEMYFHTSHPRHLQQSRSVQHLPLTQSQGSDAGSVHSYWSDPWGSMRQQMPQMHGHRSSMSGPTFQTPQMPQFSPTLTSPAQSQYSPHPHFGALTPHMGGHFLSPSADALQQSASMANLPPEGLDAAGFSEQRLSAALASSASISSGPPAILSREGRKTPTIVEEAEGTQGRTGRERRSSQAQQVMEQQHQYLHQQYQGQLLEQHLQQDQHQPPEHHFQQQPIQQAMIPRRGSDQVRALQMNMDSSYRMHVSYAPAMRPSLYQHISMAEMSHLRPPQGVGDCSSFIENYIRQYISSPSRLGLGERNVLIMTTKVAQKSYGAEKRFLCPPPLVILIGSSWWNVCAAANRPPGYLMQAPDEDQSAPTVLTPPRVTINISGEAGVQDGSLEWASSSGRLIDVGNPSSEMAISGRCIGKQLYISDVDEKRRHVEALVSISVPGSTPGDRKLLGTFPSKPIKVISKPSKKRQSSRNTELCVNHGSVISLFHRLRSQTVSTRYLCVSGAPSWFKGSDNQPFLNMNPRDQKGQEPPSCFVAKMSSWDPFIVYLIDPKKRPDATPAEPLQPAVKGYPPPPPNALPTTGLTSSQMTVHYNQPIVLQCLNTAVVSPVMVIRKVEKGTSVLGGAPAGPGSFAREAFGDPVSQLHKIALEVLEDPGEDAGDSGELGQSGPFLACLNESVGMHRPTEPRKWVPNSSYSIPSTPTTPATPMNISAAEYADLSQPGTMQGNLSASPSAYAAAQTRYSLGGSRASFMSPGSAASSIAAAMAEPPPSSDGGKVKRARRLSSFAVAQKERAAATAASKSRRRGQSLSTGSIQSQGLSEGDIIRRTGSYTNLSSLDQPAASGAALGSVWSVDVADSDIWTVVGTDIARHSFYVPPQIVGGSEPQDSVADSSIAHLITVPAPSQPITPIPLLLNVIAPGRDGRSPMPPNQPSDQGPGMVTLLGENFHPNLLVYFGDCKSSHIEIRSSQTIVCAPPPSFESGLPRGRVPILIVRQDGIIFPTEFHYRC